MAFFGPDAVLAHLQKYIPRLSERFTTNTTVSAEIIAGTPQTLRIADPSHGLTAKREVVLIDGTINNPITAVELFVDAIGGDVLRFTTTVNHNITKDYTGTVTLSGFTDSSFNGTFDLVSSPSRTTFEISGSSAPTLTGAENLVEDWEIGTNGLFKIDSIVDADTYNILLIGRPVFDPQTVPSLKRAKGGFNMAAAVDVKRAEALYTKQASDKSSLWLFVIMGEGSASKDRYTSTDARALNVSGQADRTLMINNFSIVVFFPTETETAGTEAVQLAWEEILQLLFNVMSGVKFTDFGTTEYLSVLIDHGALKYNNAFYQHAYTFEYSYEITQEQNFTTRFIESVPFRDNGIETNEADEGSNINMDDET